MNNQTYLIGFVTPGDIIWILLHIEKVHKKEAYGTIIKSSYFSHIHLMIKTLSRGLVGVRERM